MVQARKRSSGTRPEVLLARHFLDSSGYVRHQNPDVRDELGDDWHYMYKKGWEVRLLVDSKTELSRVRGWLRQAGFRPGKPFTKGNRICQPVYGREDVERFLELVAGERRARRRRRKR